MLEILARKVSYELIPSEYGAMFATHAVATAAIYMQRANWKRRLVETTVDLEAPGWRVVRELVHKDLDIARGYNSVEDNIFDTLREGRTVCNVIGVKRRFSTDHVITERGFGDYMSALRRDGATVLFQRRSRHPYLFAMETETVVPVLLHLSSAPRIWKRQAKHGAPRKLSWSQLERFLEIEAPKPRLVVVDLLPGEAVTFHPSASALLQHAIVDHGTFKKRNQVRAWTSPARRHAARMFEREVERDGCNVRGDSSKHRGTVMT